MLFFIQVGIIQAASTPDDQFGLNALRKALYSPPLNYLARHTLRPFAELLPERAYLPVTGAIRIRLENDKTIRIACNPTSYLAKMLFYRGQRGYEQNLTRPFTHLVQQSTLFIDAGANIGYYSLLAAAYHPRIRVGSFEPLPAAFTYLKENIKLNEFESIISAYPVALSDSTGKATFTVSRNPKFEFVADHLTSTGGFDASLAQRSDLIDTFEVETMTLNEAASTFWPDLRVDLVKIDVEGSELSVLSGSKRILSEHRPIVFCEILPPADAPSIVALLRERAYRFFRPVPAGLVPTDTLSEENPAEKNFVLVPEEKLSTVEPLRA